ncbi:MAG: hypothetical protein K2X69_16240 [Silvanigrellaceae bacterium]|nr:hypothetical protein [Silvanigrellaceae bacterium]
MKIANIDPTPNPVAPVRSEEEDLMKEVNHDIHKKLGQQFQRVNRAAPQCLGNFSQILGSTSRDLLKLSNMSLQGESRQNLQIVSAYVQKRIERETEAILMKTHECNTTREEARLLSKELSKDLGVPLASSEDAIKE